MLTRIDSFIATKKLFMKSTTFNVDSCVVYWKLA
jgi:hypothetical protein